MVQPLTEVLHACSDQQASGMMLLLQPSTSQLGRSCDQQVALDSLALQRNSTPHLAHS